jgi:hypothetical protein
VLWRTVRGKVLVRRGAAREGTELTYDADASVDPEDLLPKWLQPRHAT